jgi:hypothetical protein
MKKRFFSMVLCIIAAMTLCVFPLTVGAEDLGTVRTELTELSAADEPTPDPEPSPTVPAAPEGSDGGDSTYHTLFSRVWEFVSTYPEESVSILGTLVLVVFNIVLKVSGSKTSKDTKRIKESVESSLETQTSMVNVFNQMIDGYNAMDKSYKSYGLTEDNRNRIVGAVFATNTAILEILTTVYANSKNLPQGVKDLVNLKYANCLKTLEDDEKLCAIVQAVRNNIGTYEENTEDSVEQTGE